MLFLYVKEGCPFCERVLRFAEKNKIPIHQKDIYKDKENLQELLKTGGKRQVPFLVDTEKNVFMYESSDIIRYLEKNYVKRGWKNEKNYVKERRENRGKK
ncbi:glutathione S-transferase N-terminal domain-containing protein [Candidatus Aerophobetes bacterium]|nr:glutathione S-transferase N-terminal domain-containing protein [Candidatus Aerophobetes bacterium]